MTSTSPKLIKRYANRKLYDTKRSCYVTLDEIAQMVKAGEDVKIVDNKTKEDMTAVTLAQIIFEQEKKTSRMPLDVLRGMIQQGGEVLTDFFQRTVTTPVGRIQGEMEKSFERVFHRGEGDKIEGAEAAEESRNMVRAFMDASSHTFEDWQKRVDDQVHRAMSTMTNLSTLGSELQALRSRVSELEETLS
ncbi:MAG: polyhydroxyalkanoate synthesis regulator DNA-binding domain-containing protein, partial [Pseudomonadota bacterium]